MNEHAVSKQPAGNAGRIVARTVMWLFLLATAILTLFPLAMTLSGSLKTGAEMMTGGSLLPAKLRLPTMRKRGSKPTLPAIRGTVRLSPSWLR